MRLTKEQEALLAVLVAVTDYEMDEDYEDHGLLDKIGELQMEEHGFDLDSKIEDFKKLSEAGLIEFDCMDEEYRNDMETSVTYLEVLDKGREYLKHMGDPKVVKAAREIWEYAVGVIKDAGININIEFNGVKMGK